MITMKILTQLAIVFGICLVGECISAILPFAFPSSVIGMIILFLLMLVKIIKERHIKDVSQFMLKNMAFFFIPVAVSIMDNITYLQGHIMVFLLICIVATLLTFIATSYAVIGVMKLQEKKKEKRGQKHHE